SQRPVDLALSPDGSLIALSTTQSTFLLDAASSEVLANFDRTGRSVAGLAFSPEGDRIYYSRGSAGEIGVAEIEAGGEVEMEPSIDLGSSAYPGGLSLSADGATIYVALFGLNQLGVVDIASGDVITASVGSTPFGAFVSPDGARVFVSNWGGSLPGEDDVVDGLYNQIAIDPQTGATVTGSVSVYDIAGGEVIADVMVGLHPTAIAFDAASTRMYVANSNSDTVSVVDIASDDFPVVEEIMVRPSPDFPFGSMPNALDVSADGATLYVANGGNNAIAVVQLGAAARSAEATGDAGESSLLAGMIPTEWFPVSVALSPDDATLYVANNKGQGSTNFLPGFVARSVYAVTGSLTTIPAPTADELAAYTEQVDANSEYMASLADALQEPRADVAPVPVPERVGEPSVFEHVIYVIKENRTFDQVLGAMEMGNGDPSLTMFGEDATPNHHALARRFGLLDSFFTSTINSADGHMWVNESVANVFTERVFGYYPLGMYGSASLNLPVDSLWSNALAHDVSIRNYGEMTLHATQEIQADGTYTVTEDWSWSDIYADWQDEENERFRFEAVGNLIPWLQENSMIEFPGYDLTIPDQMRVDLWEREFAEYVENGELPQLSAIWLPVDHTAGTSEGYPTPQAMLADNDLALGRVVEAVSNSPYWTNTVIFVVEDDSQDGVDHVDGHRTIAYAISAYSRPGAVISTPYNQTSMVRTIEQILGMPPINQFDLTAALMTEVFTTTPNLEPYTALPNTIALDTMNPNIETLEGQAR
ncbi:MAG: bifunctional YncE family protein/alkaline phosphatase family protein, partial [Caldilineaceae bacterium]